MKTVMPEDRFEQFKELTEKFDQLYKVSNEPTEETDIIVQQISKLFATTPCRVIKEH